MGSQDRAMTNLLERVFNSVNLRTKSNGNVRIHDVTTALVLMSRYDPESKLRALFSIFDADDDGCVALDEIFDLFVSVKTNDLTCHGPDALADQMFGGELSLQAAKRLFELTVRHLSVDTDIVIFDDFHKALQA